MSNVKSLVLVLALFAATSAMAEGFYAGAGVGLTQIEDSDDTLDISFKDNPFGFRLLAGFDFNENFGIEGSYINSGKAEDDILGENVEVELSAFTIAAVGLLPVSESTKLFGKIGFFSGEQEVTVFGDTFDEDEDGMTVGAGIRFATSDTFAIRDKCLDQ